MGSSGNPPEFGPGGAWRPVRSDPVPAALIHDRLIGIENGPSDRTDVLADRYFRSMLEAVGMSRLRRGMMWAAVAFRATRPAIA
jgi:Protein of unknown function (DUF1353)